MIRLGIALALVLAVVVSLPACDGGSAANRLGGSVTETYNLDFDQLLAFRQEVSGKFDSVILEYTYKPGTNQTRIPVKVIVKAPITAGQPRDLMNGGQISRTMTDFSEFPKMKQGTITFDELGNAAGGPCSGKFFVTFEADQAKGGVENTLNGDFSATLQLRAM